MCYSCISGLLLLSVLQFVALRCPITCIRFITLIEAVKLIQHIKLFQVGDAVVGDAVACDAVVGDVVVRDAVVGDAVVGGAVVGDYVSLENKISIGCYCRFYCFANHLWQKIVPK